MENRVVEEQVEPVFTVEVSGGKTLVVYSILRAILAVPIAKSSSEIPISSMLSPRFSKSIDA